MKNNNSNNGLRNIMNNQDPKVRVYENDKWMSIEEKRMYDNVSEYYQVTNKELEPKEHILIEDVKKPLIDHVSAAPVALRSEMYSQSPSFNTSAPGSITITHREMVSAVQGTANLDTFPVSYRLQPGSPITFPWLSKIANMFETYTFKALRFIYVPRVATSYAGQIGLALDFDADDVPATSLSHFSQYKHSVIGSIWSGVSIAVEGEMLEICVKERYTDHMSSKSDYDPILHDLGNLRLAVLSPADSNVIGQLYVEYTVVLRTPEPGNNREGQQYATDLTVVGATLTYPFGTDEKSPPVDNPATYNEIGHEWFFNGTSWQIKFLDAGYYRLGIRRRVAYVAGEWDTDVKCRANCYGVDSLVGGSGLTLISGFPVTGETSAEVWTNGSNLVKLDDYFIVQVTEPAKSNTNIHYTVAGNAGWTGSKALTGCYLYIEAIDHPNVITHPGQELGLSPQQYQSYIKSTVRPQLGNFWKDAAYELYNMSGPAGKYLYNRYFGDKKKTKRKVKKALKLHSNKKKPKSKK